MPGWFDDLKNAHEAVIRSKLTGDDEAIRRAQATLQQRLLDHGTRIFSILGLFYDDHKELEGLIISATMDGPQQAGERFRRMADNYVARHTN